MTQLELKNFQKVYILYPTFTRTEISKLLKVNLKTINNILGIETQKRIKVKKEEMADVEQTTDYGTPHDSY